MHARKYVKTDFMGNEASDSHLYAKMPPTMTNCLRKWEQAGPQPFEVLQAEGLGDCFINQLYENPITLNYPLYRGTIRHQELQPGDTFDYTYPTSWSLSSSMAFNFIEGMGDDPVMFKFESRGEIPAIYNDVNTYGEEEVIIAPIKLMVTGREMISMDGEKVILLHVSN